MSDKDSEYEIKGHLAFRHEASCVVDGKRQPQQQQVWSRKREFYFGVIRYFRKWGCHVFYPDPGAEQWFSSDCLKGIQGRLEELDATLPGASKGKILANTAQCREYLDATRSLLHDRKESGASRAHLDDLLFLLDKYLITHVPLPPEHISCSMCEKHVCAHSEKDMVEHQERLIAEARADERRKAATMVRSVERNALFELTSSHE